MKIRSLFYAVAISVTFVFAADMPKELGHPKPGQSHWYDAGCCDMRDCEALPDDAVHQTQTGYHVCYLASSGLAVDVVIPSDKVRPSRDHQWHGCASQVRFLCLYGQMGV